MQSGNYKNKCLLLQPYFKQTIMPTRILYTTFLLIFICSSTVVFCQEPVLLNDPVDVSKDFKNFVNTYYTADSIIDFDPATGSGHVRWIRNRYADAYAFNNETAILVPDKGNYFPAKEYPVDPDLPFSVDFVSPKTIRLRMTSGLQVKPGEDSLMIPNTIPVDHSWQYEKIADGYLYRSAYGSVTILFHPWKIEFRNADGKLLTSSFSSKDNHSITAMNPFSFMRRAEDNSRSFAPVFSLQAGEKIFGCGESFTRLDKRGQKVILWTDDVYGVELPGMYKPIPFFMSSNGYGMFMHTTSPITCDFGASYNDLNRLFIGDDALDLFVFFGSPKEILDEYTNLTGKSPLPPLWSFGLWMSRITYSSEDEVRDVAKKLREYKVPADVIHLDVGWFETDWHSDYKFSTTRFKDPKKMISDLKQDGLHISLWQLPYFVPKNEVFPELIKKNLVILDRKGNLPTEDAILDFSNPAAVNWYQQHLEGLLKMGVGAIKVDFGEGAPNSGLYHSGRTGFYEHNLYPLRYNKAAADITKKVTGENIIWARSAWAGSQRYPLHWGGDAANTSTAMSASLRGGLSFGLSGFSFWSHDIGGFAGKTPEELYRRWMPFGMLTSHSRCHGAPPKEPWAFSKSFLDEYREDVNMKYELMPYVYAQAKYCSDHGLPMVRALFVEYPDDPGAWLIDDEYLFGSDILVAPLFNDNVYERNVYLPGGNWIDYQTKKIYTSGWHKIKSGDLPVVMLVRDGAVIPKIKLAQSTMDMDWSNITLVTYTSDAAEATGYICLPSDNLLHPLVLKKSGSVFRLTTDPLQGKVKWKISSFRK